MKLYLQKNCCKIKKNCKNYFITMCCYTIADCEIWNVNRGILTNCIWVPAIRIWYTITLSKLHHISFPSSNSWSYKFQIGFWIHFHFSLWFWNNIKLYVPAPFCQSICHFTYKHEDEICNFKIMTIMAKMMNSNEDDEDDPVKTRRRCSLGGGS